MYKVLIVGDGAYGTALACVASRANPNDKIALYSRSEARCHEINTHHTNQQRLPNVALPKNIEAFNDLEQAIKSTNIIIISVPSQAFVSVMTDIVFYKKAGQGIAWVTKGFEAQNAELFSTVAKRLLNDDNVPIAVLSGPSFAKEMAIGLPTAVALASTDKVFAQNVADAFHHHKTFHVYHNTDMIGVQIGGAAKNVIAIIAGISDGMSFGANARMAILTRGLDEILNLGLAVGAQSKTFMGLACLGDLALTCTDNQSRNRRFGLAIGSGKTIDEALEEIGTVEGYKNTKELYRMAKQNGVNMPLTTLSYKMLYERKSPKAVIRYILQNQWESQIE